MTDRQTWVRTSIKTYLKWVNFVLKDDDITTLDQFRDGNIFKKLINSFYEKMKPFKILPPSENTYKNLQELDNVISFLSSNIDQSISKYDPLALYDGNQTQILSILYIIYITFAFNTKRLRIKGTIKSKKTDTKVKKNLKNADSPGTLPDDLPVQKFDDNIFMSPIKSAPKQQAAEQEDRTEVDITTENPSTNVEVPKIRLKKSDIQKWILELGRKFQIPRFDNIIDADNNKLLLVRLVRLLVKNKIAKSDEECLLDSTSFTNSEELSQSNSTMIDREEDTVVGSIDVKRLDDAIQTANEKFGIPKLLDADDNAQFLDHASIILYFSAFIKYKSQIDLILDKRLIDLKLVSVTSYPDKGRKNLLTQLVLKSEVEILQENISCLQFTLVREEDVLNDTDSTTSISHKSDDSIKNKNDTDNTIIGNKDRHSSVSYISTVSCVSEFSEKSVSKSNSKKKGSEDEDLEKTEHQNDFDEDEIDSVNDSLNNFVNRKDGITGKYLVLELKCNKIGKYNLIVSISKPNTFKRNQNTKHDSLFNTEDVVKTLNMGLNKGINEETINWDLTKKLPFVVSSNISSAKLSLHRKDKPSNSNEKEKKLNEFLYLVPTNSDNLELKLETFDSENALSIGYHDKITAFYSYYNKSSSTLESDLGSMESEELFIKDVLFNSSTKRSSVNYYKLKLNKDLIVLNNFVIVNMNIKNLQTNDIFLFFVDTQETFIKELHEELKQLDTDAVDIEGNSISIKNKFFYNLLAINSLSKQDIVKFDLEKNEITNIELDNTNKEFKIILYFKEKETLDSEDLLKINVPSLQVKEKIHINLSKDTTSLNNTKDNSVNSSVNEIVKERAPSNNLEQVWRLEKENKLKEYATEFINSKEGMYIIVLQHKRTQCFNINQLSIIKDDFKDINKDKLFLKVKDKSKFLGSASRKIDISSITSIVKGKKTTGFDMFNNIRRRSSITSFSKGFNFLRKNIKAKNNTAYKRAKKFAKNINESRDIKSSQCLSVICPEVTINIVAESSSDRNYMHDCLMGLIMFEDCVKVKSNFICNNGRKLKECMDKDWYEIIDLN